MKTTWEVTVKEKNGSVLHPSYTGEDVTREDVIKFFDLEGDDVESYELRLVSENNGMKLSYNEKKAIYNNILESVDKIIKKRLITEDLDEDDDWDFDNDENTELTDDIKRKVEKYLKKNEGAVSIEWGKDSCTIFDENGIAIEDFMIDVEDDGEIYYTPVSTPSVTLCIEDDDDDEDDDFLDEDNNWNSDVDEYDDDLLGENNNWDSEDEDDDWDFDADDEELPYLSDERIAEQYQDFKITSFSYEQSELGGYTGVIELEFPNVDHEDFDSTKIDNFIVYDDDCERIAFDNWYPNDVYKELCEYIRKKINR